MTRAATKAAVFGTGSWGTAFAMVLADAGCEVTLWGRRAELVDADQHHPHQPRLSAGNRASRGGTGHHRPRRGRGAAPTSPSSPSPPRPCAATSPPGRRCCAPDTVLVSLMKGVELGTAKRMSEVIEEVAKVPAERVAVRHRPQPRQGDRRSASPPPPWSPAATRRVAQRLQAACHTPYFRPYTNTDVVGCELGGAVKNVIGLAVGIADGMGLGDNAKGSLITRGLAETTRLGLAMGADPLTFSGLAGLGDLVATCSSPLSRNHTFGTNLGRGMTLAGDHRGHQADRRGRQVL